MIEFLERGIKYISYEQHKYYSYGDQTTNKVSRVELEIIGFHRVS